MATTAKIVAIGNSAGIVLPKEIMARLNLEKGDSVYVTEEPKGLRVTPFDPDFATQMEAAREVMRENRDVLQRLAERANQFGFARTWFSPCMGRL
jgi:putative addiction module antidote